MGVKTKIESQKKEEIELRDSKAEVYDSLIPGYQHYVEITTTIRKLNPKPDELILDLGCGTGRITSKILEKGSLVIGLDFSKESLRLCDLRAGNSEFVGNLYLFRGDGCKLPFRDEVFDKCVSSQVLQHIPSDEERTKMLQEVHRVLKKDGKFVFTTYNLSLRKLIGRKKETYGNGLYNYRYNSIELKNSVSKFFTDIKIHGILNLIHWIPIKLLNKNKSLFASLDFVIESTHLSHQLAHLILVECKKEDK